jgi:hypothetical protein
MTTSAAATADGAVEVGAVGADVGGLEFGEDFGAGMAVAVVESAGDDGPLGGDAGEERGAGGGDAAVVAHFEQGAGEGVSGEIGLGDHCVFDGGFGVAFEQDGGGSPGHAQDE